MYLEEVKETCPFCWESIWLLVDPSDDQMYIEDCSVCCRPILVKTTTSNSGVTIVLAQEDDGF
ncbi:MAG: hypothetical protein CBC09_03845 [Cellvibrionales bacterium TMED49]|nr:hypothetical protein [Porticoccaceae bacterium]OUU38953.1 MAG: hypothetical protein CBC09_03845 [Cellvibrionales bacterium TMED49]